MDTEEASDILSSKIAELRSLSYDILVERYLDESRIFSKGSRVETAEVTGSSGTLYQLEVQAFWDSGSPGNLRVLVAIDDSSRAWQGSPMTDDFIVTPAGSFIGE